MITGPPMVAPGLLERPLCCFCESGLVLPLATASSKARRAKCCVAFQRCCQCWSYTVPWNLLVPDFVLRLTVAPEVCPKEASKLAVSRRNSPTASLGAMKATRLLDPVLGAPSMVYSFMPTPPAVLNADVPPPDHSVRLASGAPVHCMPGASPASTYGFMSEYGSSMICRLSTTRPADAELVSSSGACSTTSTTSDTLPNCSVTSMEARLLTLSSMPLRTNFRKPVFSTVTE